MRKHTGIINAFYIILISILAISCGESGSTGEKLLPKAGGKHGELVVVVDTTYWNGKTGDALISTFAREQQGLPQREPVFDIVQIPHRAFSSVFKHTKNIVIIDIKKGKKASFSSQENKWAKPQLVVNITAPDDQTAASILQKNDMELLNYFRDAELERLAKKLKKRKDKKLNALLKKKHSLTLSLSPDYKVALDTNGFTWLKKEQNINGHHLSQSLLIYHYNYTMDSAFQKNHILYVRDSVARRFVEGPVKNSYMKTYREYNPVKRETALNGTFTVELRGLWNTEGAFMGGPFINYTFVHEKSNQVVHFDAFVFAPKFDKREYLRELEGITHTLQLEKEK